jgi:N-acetylated-alpha-linked acidic dipeptidase
MRTRQIDQARTDADKDAIRRRTVMPLDALGSGSDYTVFLDHLAIASLNLGFGGDGGGGIYHSNYDTLNWYLKFSDGEFKHGAALSQTIGTALLRLADAEVLPFEFAGTVQTLTGYVNEIDKLAVAPGQKLDLGPLRSSLTKLASAASAYERAMKRLSRLPTSAATTARLAELNKVLYSTERAFLHEAGLPRREWFKHLAYAPGFYTGYGVKTLPGIREGIEQKQWDEARAFIPIVARAIDTLTADVRKAAKMLADL